MVILSLMQHFTRQGGCCARPECCGVHVISDITKFTYVLYSGDLEVVAQERSGTCKSRRTHCTTSLCFSERVLNSIALAKDTRPPWYAPPARKGRRQGVARCAADHW
jgi:hypothetical protein